MPRVRVTAGASAPARFRQAVASLRATAVRAEVALREIPAPSRLAPYAFAMSAEVVSDNQELADGSLIVLFDPVGVAAWEGRLRIVTYVRAAVEPEMAQDPLLPAVGWSWLLDALATRGARHRAASGAVTRTSSARFGTMADHPDAADVELRASWTPTDADLGAHLSAWCDLLCATAGLPPPGIGAIATR